MTAIDPARLERDVEDVLALFPDMKRVTRRAEELMERYTDRTRLPGRSSTSKQRLTVPRPVVRELARGLVLRTASGIEEQTELADSLWKSKHPELRRAATLMLSMRDDEGVAGLAERWARSCQRSDIRASLAGPGIRAWRSSHPELLLPHVEAWLEKPWTKLQAFALQCLVFTTIEPAFDDLPMVFRMLQPLKRFQRREVRTALIELMDVLIERSPAEAAFFLLEELENGGKTARRIARKTLPAFPAAQQRLIQRALST